MRRARILPLLRSQNVRLVSRFYSVRVLGNTPKPIKTVSDLRNWQLGEGESHEIEVNGWVKNVRKGAGFRFVEISDGSSMRSIQAVVEKDMAKADE